MLLTASARFGKLVLQSLKGKFWYCKCDCGKYVFIHVRSLKQSTSCSMCK